MVINTEHRVLFTHTESFPKLLALNKVDILMAVKRFGNKRREVETATRGDEDEDAPDPERRKKRAKKAGILVPVFGEAFANQGGIPAVELVKKRPKSNELVASSRDKPKGDRMSRGSIGKPDETENRASWYSSGGDLEELPISPAEVSHTPKHRKHLVGGVKLLPDLRTPSETRQVVGRDQQSQGDAGESREVYNRRRPSGDGMSPPRSSTPEHSAVANSPRQEKRPESWDEAEKRASQYGSGGDLEEPPKSPAEVNHSPKHRKHLIGGVKLLPDLQVPESRQAAGRDQRPLESSRGDTKEGREVYNPRRPSADGMSPSRSSRGTTPEHTTVANSPRRGKRPVGQARQLVIVTPSAQHQTATLDFPSPASEYPHSRHERQVDSVPCSPSSVLTHAPRAHPNTNGIVATPPASPRQQNGVHPSRVVLVAATRVPLKARESGEISLDYIPEQNGHICHGNLSTVNSSSVPNLLDDDPPVGHPSNHVVSPKHGQMSRSTDNLLEEYSENSRLSSSNGIAGPEHKVGGRRWSGASSCSSQGQLTPQVCYTSFPIRTVVTRH